MSTSTHVPHDAAGIAAEPAPSTRSTGCPPPLLVGRNVRKRIDEGRSTATILDGVTVELGAGERVALLGPSGSGKTTLLSILAGLDGDFDGDVVFDGVHFRSLSDAQLARFRNRTMGFVFQSYNLLGHLSVLENVLLPARFSGVPVDRRRAHDLLSGVGLASMAHRRPLTLSGGERQRVAIARALYNHPKVVFCDEPTGNLDRDTGAEILQLFDRLTADGVALLIATHDDAIAAGAHRVVRMARGVMV